MRSYIQKHPFLVLILVFILTLVLVQFLAYQQYLVSKEKEHEALFDELNNVKDKFRSILSNDIAAANTLAIIYKEYGVPKHFDSVAKQILRNSKYVEAIQLTRQGIITNVYPLKGRENSIGINTLSDSLRKKEAEIALDRNVAYFAGPRKLREGGVGILGKVPIVVNDKLIGFSVVLTRLSTIIKALDPEKHDKNKFAYILSKVSAKNVATDYLLTNEQPNGNSELLSIMIPEGDWRLCVAYSANYPLDSFPNELSAFGILFSIIAGLFAYRIAREPAVLQEIIESKTRQLASSEKYFRTLIETSSDAIVLMDATGKVIYQTPSTERISGYSLEEIQRIDGLDLIHPDDRETDNNYFVQFVQHPGSVIERKHRLRHKNGSYIWIEGAYQNLLQDENVRAIVFYYRDVTEINTERGRRIKTEERLQTTMENMPVGCKIISFDWRYTYINNEAARQAFRTKEEILGNTIYEVHTGVESSNLYAMYKRCMEERVGVTFEEQYTYSNGVNCWYDFKIEPVDEGIFIMTIDITEKRKTLEDIIRTRHLLNERVKELSTIYQLHNILQDEDQSADEVFTKIVNILPSGWQYPEICEARIGFDGKEYTTRGYRPSDFRQQAPIETQDGRNGMIEVLYTEEKTTEAEGQFLKEERDLINTIAEIIRIYFNKKLNQEALANSEERFRGAFEFSAIGMTIVSLNGERIKVNQAFCNMLGYSEDELLLLTFQETIHPDDLATDAERLREMRAGLKDYQRVERRYIHKNGSLVWVNLNTAIIKDANSVPQYFVSQIENITEKKAVLNELKQSEANLRSIFDNSDIMYLLLDTDYNIVAYNKIMQDIYKEVTGYMIEAGTNLIEILIPDKREAVKTIYDNVALENKSIQYETAYTLKDGFKYFMAHVVPISLNDNVNGICISSIEITAIKKLEIERQKIIADLLQRNSDLQQFAHIVSHNIRGPLSTILGLNNLLAEEIPDVEKDYLLEGIRKSSERLDIVIKDMNEILQIRRELSETKVEVDLNKVLADIKGSISALLADSKAVIESDFTEIDKFVTIRSYINSIFYNLVTNSIKYARPGTAPLIKISSLLQNGIVILTFTDNGMGIDLNKYKDRLFGLYQRFYLSVEGKGVGLYMTKTQVEVLNGTIEMESEPGIGTTCIVMLPA